MRESYDKHGFFYEGTEKRKFSYDDAPAKGEWGCDRCGFICTRIAKKYPHKDYDKPICPVCWKQTRKEEKKPPTIRELYYMNRDNEAVYKEQKLFYQWRIR